jgi:rhodanese-related sulfurtransferase
MRHAPGFLKLVDEAKARIRQTNVREVKEQIDAKRTFTIVDVREESEWAAGHLPGAVHLSKGIIERDIENAIPGKATPMVLYCGGGFRSALVADNLQKMGYTNVFSMDGGWHAWVDAVFPIAKD